MNMDKILPHVIVLFYSVIRVYLTPVVLRGEMMIVYQVVLHQQVNIFKSNVFTLYTVY